jgi:hypothetical protein
VADLNQDGYLDVIEGNDEAPNFVYLGNENGGFNAVSLNNELKDETYHISVGDLNNDGLIDIVESNSGSMNLYYLTRKSE